MLRVRVQHDQIQIGRHFTVSFQRTLRIPDDGGTYPLPPSLGAFPISRVRDYARRVPAAWREHGGVFIPMYQREAMWLDFGGAPWRPTAVKVAVGKVNAISAQPWSERLSAGSDASRRGAENDGDGGQDYVVCPDQPWLDGINAGTGFVRQFVAMPLGMGYTVEGQVTGAEEFGGVQIAAYDPKPGRFPDRAPRSRTARFGAMGCIAEVCCLDAAPGVREMGLAAGGRMHQSIYPDPYGVDTWDPENMGRVYVHIVDSLTYREITGQAPPPSPVSARTYTQAGLPWFGLYDEAKGDLAPSTTLSGVESVKAKDAALGFAPQQDDSAVDVPDEQVVTVRVDSEEVDDGVW
jgi:hypothetical protein